MFLLTAELKAGFYPTLTILIVALATLDAKAYGDQTERGFRFQGGEKTFTCSQYILQCCVHLSGWFFWMQLV